jgi:hypothetical protein
MSVVIHGGEIVRNVTMTPQLCIYRDSMLIHRAVRVINIGRGSMNHAARADQAQGGQNDGAEMYQAAIH